MSPENEDKPGKPLPPTKKRRVQIFRRDQASSVGDDGLSVTSDESAGFDPYDTASLYVEESPDSKE